MQNIYLRAGKIAGSAAIATLLLGGANLAFAQSYANPDGTGSVVPSSNSSIDTGTSGGSSLTGSSSTTDTSGMTGSSSTPGIPNTGAGGDVSTTLGVLGVSALAAIGAAAYLARQRFALRV